MEKKYPLRVRSFYKFLKKNRLFQKYLYNLRKQHPYSHGMEEYDEDGDILQLLSVNGNIDHSFCWADTPQGHRYWENLCNREVNEYRENQRVFDIMHTATSTTTYDTPFN